MRIGIDGTIWGGEETGVSASTRRLCLRLADAKIEHELTVFAAEAGDFTQTAAYGDDRLRVVRAARGSSLRRLLWKQLVLPVLTRRQRLDVLYCPCYTIPLRGRVPSVVTVHDMIAWNRPELCRLRNVIHFRTLVGASVRRARCVTVPTETVKQDVLDRLNVAESKVHVVPWGIDFEIESLERSTAMARVRASFGIDYPFVLFVGALEPKKNPAAVLEATRRCGARLVVAGPPGWGARAIRHEFSRERTGHGRHLGYVSVTQLSSLYCAAEVLVFPSHSEGFGMPVLEAMACGTPVVASDAPALREICGGAALHVPAGNVSALAEGLGRLIENVELREELVRRGQQRAREFTWERSVRLFCEVLERSVES